MDAYPKGKASTIPTNLIGQLLFRDMYFAAQASLGYSFAQTAGNSHVRFVPWHLPSVVSPSTGLVTGAYTIDSAKVETWFQRWKYGRTGFPWIDALMRQLRQEGWIHHLGRHAVACFLTRGGCYVDWERGAEVFEEWLIDHETACNAGNWQWLSCTAFYSQFYRCYSPIAFPKKSDKGGAFVRHFVPELKDFPDKYIYEPWKAPIADQKKAKCIIKGDGNEPQDEVYDPRDTTGGTIKTYPKPMFDFDQRRTICIEALKSAYKINLYGDDPRVKDGTWKSLFPDSAEGPTEGNEPPSGAGGQSDGPTREVGGEMKGEALRGRGRGRVRKDVDTEKEDGGVDQDEREAAEVGGETKGGEKQGVGKRKRQRQVTLDGIVERGGKRGR
jgi:cryptochrome